MCRTIRWSATPLMILLAPLAAWGDSEAFSILVEVSPRQLGNRTSDAMPAAVRLDFEKLVKLPADRRIDFATLRVKRIEGEAEASAAADAAHAWRFYDESLLDAFPIYSRYISVEAQNGRPLFQTENIPFGHRLFNAVGAGRNGTLVWDHVQQGDRATRYRIEFALLPVGATPAAPPVGWIGDGGNRIVEESPACGPPGNNSGCVVDWNGDGRPDLLYGSSAGNLVALLNTADKPPFRFASRHVLYDAVGVPIDVGYDSYPHVADFDGDGTQDLLVGAEKGCVLFYRNAGTNADPRLTFKGFVQADENMLLTPNWPIAELPGTAPGDVYPQDYLAMPCVVDWDDDGDRDLLVGGFVTGRVFYYENVGSGADGVPTLRSRGPLVADDQPIDTAWGAAPLAVDLDDDGDLDLLCGAKPITATGGDVSRPGENLFYFENRGSRRKPVLSARPFPMTGPPPTGDQLSLGLADFDGDNLNDLVLFARSSMRTFVAKNVGTRSQPKFDMNAAAIPGRWNNQPLPTGQLIDWNRDGVLDLLGTFTVLPGERASGGLRFGSAIGLLPRGQRVHHAAPHGDGNPGIAFCDMDGDGDFDCLYGAHSGHVWLHENRGDDDRPDWDVAGRRLRLVSGEEIQVGIRPADWPQKFDFTALQGARAKPAGDDFDGDGLVDLVVADTFGTVRAYRNVGTQKSPMFAEPIVPFASPNRASVVVARWNEDNKPDVLVILGNRVVMLMNESVAGSLQFAAAETLVLPRGTGQLHHVAVGDWNGDGDADVLYHDSHRMSFLAEGSFLRDGYQWGTLMESRSGPSKN